MRFSRIIISLLLSTLIISTASANQCRRIHIGLINWTDIEATTALTSVLMEQLGFRIRTSVQKTIPKTLDKLSKGKVDVFLGNWMPSNISTVQPYIDAGSIVKLTTNLVGAKYTLAVPQYVHDAGVKTFQDLTKYADKFSKRIYGLEANNGGNIIIDKMISDNAYGLNDFKLVVTSEKIMLRKLSKHINNKEWIAFLAWEPHPMNVDFDIAYLDGDQQYFGANFGASTVETLVRKNFTQQCPQAAKLLKNLRFTLSMENELMADLKNNDVDPKTAAWRWMRKNPQQVEEWLKGIDIPNKKSLDDIIASFE
ncbi:MAG: glycine/betaine ABC transporter substrate-binding protein [Oleispira sp.]|nr:glycine/betaine ABC transporter substrate-binding protein [Oleispira sp.]